VQLLANMGCADDTKIIKTLEKLVEIVGDGELPIRESSKILVKVVLKVLEMRDIPTMGTDLLAKVWYLGKTGLALIDPEIVAQILERCIATFTVEIEMLIVEALEVELSEVLDCRHLQSKPAYLSDLLLVKTISVSQSLFTKSVQIFSKYFIDLEWNPRLIQFYQQLVSAVLSSAPNPVLLYPYNMQSLASLVITYNDLAKYRRGEDVAKVIQSRFDFRDFDVKMVLLQYPTIARDLCI